MSQYLTFSRNGRALTHRPESSDLRSPSAELGIVTFDSIQRGIERVPSGNNWGGLCEALAIPPHHGARMSERWAKWARTLNIFLQAGVVCNGAALAQTSDPLPSGNEGNAKKAKLIAGLLVLVFLVVTGIGLAQEANQSQALIINGQSTQVPVIQVNGRSYVDLAALASAVNGTLSFAGNQIAFSVPIGPGNTASATATSKSTSAATPLSNPGFSRGFLNAAIEEAATLREWHAALASSIANGYPLSAGALAPYRAQATTNLRLASAAVSTDSDRGAYQLLSNVFQNMGKLSDKYVAMRANMTYISPDSLQNDSSNQRLMTCGRSLSAMAASGQFVDDGSCN